MAASWAVTNDAPDQVWFNAGNPVTGHLISFITGAGNRGTVQVPDDHYTVPQVKAIIQAKANVVDGVGALREGNVQVP